MQERVFSRWIPDRNSVLFFADDSGIFLEKEIIFSGVMDATAFYPGIINARGPG
jgi:hypothetical protein